jgi:hypothetical protein
VRVAHARALSSARMILSRGPAGVAAGLFSVTLWAACGGDPAAPGAISEPLALRLETPHFRIFSDQVAEATLREVADRLEAELPRFLVDLSVADVRRVTVKIWQDPTAWSTEMERYFGRRLGASGYVAGPDEIRLLVVPQLASNATHELVHCVSRYVSSTIPNNPRWLWESVALYENRELVDPRTLDYMVGGRPPTLDQLDSDVTVSRQVYEVGYLIGESVVVRWGAPALVALIRANGDTVSVLGLSRSAFEEAWFAFVRERYLSRPSAATAHLSSH